jgi:hypothetical protein
MVIWLLVFIDFCLLSYICESWYFTHMFTQLYMWELIFYSHVYSVIYVRVDILLTWENACIISLVGEVWANKTSWAPPLLEVPVTSQESERSCYLCVRGVHFFFCFYDFSIKFWNSFDGVVFFIVHFSSAIFLGLFVTTRGIGEWMQWQI